VAGLVCTWEPRLSQLKKVSSVAGLACRTWEPRLSQLKEVSSVAGLACLYLGAKAFAAEGGV
jgi:hypothetical protein